MEPSRLLSESKKVKRNLKGNNALTTELVNLAIEQYNSDKDLGKLKNELQKIALTCSRSRLFKRVSD